MQEQANKQGNPTSSCFPVFRVLFIRKPREDEGKPRWIPTVFFCSSLLLGSWLLCGIVQAQVMEPANPEKVGMSARHLARLDGVVETAIAQRETPGAVVVVGRKGRVIYRKAFGHRALIPKPEPMTVDTIFDVASLTKVMATATSLIILVEEGKVSLSDSVSVYLPDFDEHGAGSATLLQLLTHYSGLRPDLDLDESWSGYETGVQRAYQEKLVAVPGEQFIYSDINYLLLGEVIRQVSGRHLDEFSAERIFQPLGMRKTRFNPSEENVSLFAPTELREGKMLRGQVHDPTAARMGGCVGHAGLFSTADDTAIFAQMILNGGVYSGIRILSPLSILKMTTPQSPLGQREWRGLGFDIRSRFSVIRGDLFPDGSFGHSGFTGTSLWIDPYSATFVVVFTNRLHPEGEGTVTSLRKKVSSVVAASILEAPSLRERNSLDR